MPYCNFAIIGLSEMKVKSLRRQVKGSGTIRARKIIISVTKRRNTYGETSNQLVLSHQYDRTVTSR